jgi:ABC-type polysaccharide/polyol phosphate transport system ATPase subunit
MMSDNKDNIVIKVTNLKISYRDIQSFSIKKIFRAAKKKNSWFTAVNGISFEVEKGEILGICGKNGAGKSTLLRAIAGVFSPDEGEIELFGNSISLLSIGVGFQKKLSGKDNIFLSGLLLGFTEAEIKRKYDEIVEFSELGSAIEKKVSSYSSGMYSKLAFSITAILETDIILIDEVLSVGDIHFKEKSYNKMKELINHEHRTVVIVSHSLKTLKELCNKVLWINDGVVMDIGEPKHVLREFKKFMSEEI